MQRLEQTQRETQERRACGFGWWLWGILAWPPARPLLPPAATILIISPADDAHSHFHERDCNQWCCARYVTAAFAEWGRAGA